MADKSPVNELRECVSYLARLSDTLLQHEQVAAHQESQDIDGLERALVQQAVAFEQRRARLGKEALALRARNRQLESSLLELQSKVNMLLEASVGALSAATPPFFGGHGAAVPAAAALPRATPHAAPPLAPSIWQSACVTPATRLVASSSTAPPLAPPPTAPTPTAPRPIPPQPTATEGARASHVSDGWQPTRPPDGKAAAAEADRGSRLRLGSKPRSAAASAPHAAAAAAAAMPAAAVPARPAPTTLQQCALLSSSAAVEVEQEAAFQEANAPVAPADEVDAGELGEELAAGVVHAGRPSASCHASSCDASCDAAVPEEAGAACSAVVSAARGEAEDDGAGCGSVAAADEPEPMKHTGRGSIEDETEASRGGVREWTLTWPAPPNPSDAVAASPSTMAEGAVAAEGALADGAMADVAMADEAEEAMPASSQASQVLEVRGDEEPVEPALDSTPEDLVASLVAAAASAAGATQPPEDHQDESEEVADEEREEAMAEAAEAARGHVALAWEEAAGGDETVMSSPPRAPPPGPPPPAAALMANGGNEAVLGSTRDETRQRAGYEHAAAHSSPRPPPCSRDSSSTTSDGHGQDSPAAVPPPPPPPHAAASSPSPTRSVRGEPLRRGLSGSSLARHNSMTHDGSFPMASMASMALPISFPAGAPGAPIEHEEAFEAGGSPAHSVGGVASQASLQNMHRPDCAPPLVLAPPAPPAPPAPAQRGPSWAAPNASAVSLGGEWGRGAGYQPPPPPLPQRTAGGPKAVPPAAAAAKRRQRVELEEESINAINNGERASKRQACGECIRQAERHNQAWPERCRDGCPNARAHERNDVACTPREFWGMDMTEQQPAVGTQGSEARCASHDQLWGAD